MIQRLKQIPLGPLRLLIVCSVLLFGGILTASFSIFPPFIPNSIYTDTERLALQKQYIVSVKRAKFLASFAKLDPGADLDEARLEDILANPRQRDEFAIYVHRINPSFTLSGEELAAELGNRSNLVINVSKQQPFDYSLYSYIFKRLIFTIGIYVCYWLLVWTFIWIQDGFKQSK